MCSTGRTELLSQLAPEQLKLVEISFPLESVAKTAEALVAFGSFHGPAHLGEHGDPAQEGTLLFLE
jgi:hypothetical protein